VACILLSGHHLMGLFTETEEVIDPSERTTTYKLTKVEFPSEFGADIFNVTAANGRIFVTGWETDAIQLPDGTWDQDQMLFSCDSDGGDHQLETLLPEDGFDKTASIAYTDDGSKFVTLTKMNEKGAFERVTVRRFDAEGALIGEYECGELFGLDITKLRVNMAGEGGFFVRDAYAHDGETIIVANTGIVVLTKSGERKMLIESRQEIMDSAFENGQLIVIYEDNAAKPVDMTAGVIGDRLTLPEEISAGRRLQLLALEGYDLAARTEDGVFGLTKSEDGTLTSEMLCSFLDSDIVGTSVQGFAALSPELFFASTSHPITNERALYRLEMVKKSELVEKTTLTVGTLFDMDYYAAHAIVDFNQASDEFRAVLKTYDYGVKENGAWDSAPAIQSFDLDMMSGNVPDIIILPLPNSEIDLEKYVNAGLFADLYPYLGKDTLLPSVRTTNEIDGKLYWLPTSSRISVTFTGRELGEWSLDTMMDTLDSLSPDEELLQYFSATNMVNVFLATEIGQFVDYSTGTVNFNTPTFRRFLDYYKRASTGEFSSKSEEKQYIVEKGSLSEPSRLARQLAEHGDSLQIIGSTMTTGQIWAISSKCEHPEAALELMMTRISDEYLAVSNGLMPPVVTVSALESWLEEESGMYYYVMEKSARIFRQPMTEEECQRELGPGVLITPEDYDITGKIREIIDNAVADSRIHQQVMDILYEELSDFAGKGYTVDEAVERIESRVGLYVSEQHG
ncbi:MAG: extracellular solute-binding protein, partial [Ruminococcaceae bacterium]|nr:extracellular solute-binding protein [Oscillospiraceae bacterium]